MGVKLSTASLAASLAMGIFSAPAAAAPLFTADVSGTVVSATGNWLGSIGSAFRSQQTIDEDGGAATLIEGSGIDTWWFFQSGGYGFNYTSAMLGGSLSGDTVWVETIDNFLPTTTNNPFGLTSPIPVDVVTISGGNVVADCDVSQQNDVGFCPEGTEELDGVEFSISFIATSDWFTGQGVFPSVEPTKLLAAWGIGTEFTAGAETASAIVEFDVVPLPAALPMFVAGLGMLGLLGWRRNHAAA